MYSTCKTFTLVKIEFLIPPDILIGASHKLLAIGTIKCKMSHCHCIMHTPKRTPNRYSINVVWN